MHRSQQLNDDSFSFSESLLTASSSSTLWGPGALSGKALKAVGGMSLDLLCHLTIRMRLAKIKRAIEKTPHVFHDPIDAIESQRMNEYYSDLKELCEVKYSLSVRRAAGDLIRKITLIETPERPDRSSSSVEKAPRQWEVLLAPLLPRRFRPHLRGLHSESMGDRNQIDDVLAATGDPQEDRLEVLKEVNPSSFRSHFLRGLHSESLGDRNQMYDVLSATSDPQEDSLKLLILGAGGTGKSTLAKQMAVTLVGSVQEIIRGNVLATVQTILRALLWIMKYTWEMSGDTIQAILKQICAYDYLRIQEVWHDIRPLWALPEVREAARQPEVNISGRTCIGFRNIVFLDRADQIFAADYVPTDEDILRCRVRTTGIYETAVHLSERRKWIHCYKNTTAVLFVAALPDYSRSLSEYADTNGLDDSLYLFDSVAHSDWFKPTLVILVFTKGDVLEEELKHDSESLRNWAKARSRDYADACKYIENRFTDRIKDRNRPFCLQYMCTVDATTIREKCIAVLAEIIQHHKSYPPAS
ncbi:G-protein alpha subunit-domain-containing protein [Gautieria morchelliformis]|nr:G-protein alpha subunit-domain-containing protein [Gautieria morchelliformis]